MITQAFRRVSMLTADAVIIGGGNAGTCILYKLLKMGMKKVMLFEKQLIASESTGKSAGGFRQQFSTAINIKMSKFTIDSFETLNDELGLETKFHHKGYLFLIKDETQLELYKKNIDLQKTLGVEVNLLSIDELTEIVPYINTSDIIGSTFCQKDGFTDPYEVAQGFVRASRKMGAIIKEKTPVIAIETQNNQVKALKTDKDIISTPIIINAAGPWCGEIGKLAGLNLPVEPYRRQIFTSGPFSLFKKDQYIMPMIVDPSGLYMRSEGDCILMGKADKNEPPSFNQNVEWGFLEQLVIPAANRIPAFEELEINSGWAGLYDTTPDHHALLGKVPQLEGFILACGFSGHGFMHSIAVGTTIAELVIDGKASSIDISPLSVTRFNNGAKGIEEIAVI